MKTVCVITGGGSGMGFATAKIMGGKGYYVILVGRTAAKLENAVEELKTMNIEAEAFSCDISDRTSTQLLAGHARAVGAVKTVIHASGHVTAHGRCTANYGGQCAWRDQRQRCIP
ncbi:SDR family NAD(P)-dependent oxidoreductase [Paenibacillus sp. S150]|uniref:SDR family NAD(P)-dependent oxidoreductase n=1 Tax=Paenibacillus sp. S150 TaxID=2749826 RepID=UPI001E62FD48|nr:SDR family NAD(P)-dependent oxidoreductase [Paenibacillus sp. S150]